MYRGRTAVLTKDFPHDSVINCVCVNYGIVSYGRIWIWVWVWKYESMRVSGYGSMHVWEYGSKKVWEYVSMGIYRSMRVWGDGSMRVREYESMGVWKEGRVWIWWKSTKVIAHHKWSKTWAVLRCFSCTPPVSCDTNALPMFQLHTTRVVRHGCSSMIHLCICVLSASWALDGSALRCFF